MMRAALRSCYSQVRLLELYDTVDMFVLYEIPYTHLGAVKPYYFNDSLTGGWWVRPADTDVCGLHIRTLTSPRPSLRVRWCTGASW